MLTLVLAVMFALCISAACSLAETVLYSVPWSHIEKLRSQKRPAGELLFSMRSNVDKPIAAILTLNTIANTAGSAVAGAAFINVYGPQYMAVFAAIFTVLVLTFGEIIPKTVGVAYAAPCSTFLVRPLAVLLIAFKPIIWLTGKITRLLTPSHGTTPQVSENDILAITSLGRQAGRIAPQEERSIGNILSLDQKHVWDIMTPRTVVFSLSQTLTVAEAWAMPECWHFSRIPVYDKDNEDLVGVVEWRTMGRCMTESRQDSRLSEIMQPLHFVQESLTLDRLLHELLNSRLHLFAVVDEYGGLSGVVSLEDVLEEILGSEIVDTNDPVANLRELALQRQKTKHENTK